MRPPLLTPAGRYDRAAIMREAHAEARRDQARSAALGVAPWPYALHLKHALHAVWIGARAQFDCEAETARLAALPPAVAGLSVARTIALHIDSLPAMVAELAAIDAQAARLGVRL